MITKSGKSAVVQISTVFRLVYHVYLSKGFLKRDLLDIHLTTFFGVRKVKNTSAMRVILSLKTCETESNFRILPKKMEKASSVSLIILFEDIGIICLY